MTPLNSLTKLLGIGLLAAMFSCSAFAADAPKMGADKHVAKGVACQTCHGTDLNESESSDRRNLHTVPSESSAY